MSVGGVLFDLDGTLVDTAPDLVAVLNHMLLEAGHPRMPYALARNEVSNGALGLLRLGFGVERTSPEGRLLRERFLRLYASSVCVKSNIFSGLQALINELSMSGVPWGIVTNKPSAMTLPLLEQLGLAARSVVSGDSLPQRKPHPAPLVLAAAQLGVAAAHCVYVGDAPRDVEAGRAAGMATVAAAYGYIRPSENPLAWGADRVVRRPRELAGVLTSLAQRRGTRETARAG